MNNEIFDYSLLLSQIKRRVVQAFICAIDNCTIE